MGSNDKQLAEPISVEKMIANRIRKDFIELMPKDTFEIMVKKVVNDFTKADTRYNNTKPSKFDELVESIIVKEYLAPKIIAALSTHEFSQRFDAAGKDIADRALKKFILENADIILANLMTSIISDTMMSFRQSFEQKLQQLGQY